MIYSQSYNQQNNDNPIPLLEEVLSSLSKEAQHTLLSGGSLERVRLKHDKDKLLYAPKCIYTQHNTCTLISHINNYITTAKPNVLYENLVFFETDNEDSSYTLMVQISNLLRDVPILATIEYRNLKNNNINPLFLESKRIISKDNHNTQSPLPPLISTTDNIPIDITVLQDMPPFGNVISQYYYDYSPFYHAFKGANLSPVQYSGITAIKPDDMLIACWIIRTHKGILVYGIGGVRITGIASIFTNFIENSFTSRMYGLFKWLNTYTQTIMTNDNSDN